MVSSLINKLIELRFGSLFTFLVVKVIYFAEQNKNQLILISITITFLKIKRK